MEGRRQRRDLKAFYGIENGETPSENGSASRPSAQSSDPCNLDGANFQPQTYLSKLITV